MWLFVRPLVHRHKSVLVWTRRLQLPTLNSLCASYHVSPTLLCLGSSGIDPSVRRRLRPRPAVSELWQDRHSDVSEKEIPVLRKKKQDNRVSSEVRKLCLEDFPVERERPGRQKSVLEHKAESHEIVFGIAPCLLALTQCRRKAHKLFVKDGESSRRVSVLKLCEEARQRGVQIQRVSKRDLDKMSSGCVHQGVCLKATPLSYLTDIRDPTPTRRDPPLWLVLEGIQDPMNLGAILRSAYFLGVDRVASSIRNSCPLSPVVSKASSGVMEVIGVHGYENLEDVLKVKAAQGWQVVGTVAAEAEANHIPITKCSDFRMTKPTLLLMGGEAGGLSRELLSLCQTLLTIPAGRELVPHVESLNVSVAAGILLHSLLLRPAEDAARQRRAIYEK